MPGSQLPRARPWVCASQRESASAGVEQRLAEAVAVGVGGGVAVGAGEG